MSTKILSAVVLAGAILSPTTFAIAQAPADAVMLVPGVYTTPEISAKCQKYAAQRVPSNDATSARQSVALACVKKLYDKQMKGAQVKGKG